MEYILIRKGRLEDLRALQQLCVETIREVCSADYNPEQIQAWISGFEDEHRWKDILADQYVIVAIIEKEIIGFATLKEGNYLDYLYVHRNYQARGIARQLYKEIEEEALRGGQPSLSADVSITARPFFEKMGFILRKAQKVRRRGVQFTTYKMLKEIIE